MKESKLQLNVDELQVSSFTTGDDGATPGTVQAHEGRTTTNTCWTWCLPYC